MAFHSFQSYSADLNQKCQNQMEAKIEEKKRKYMKNKPEAVKMRNEERKERPKSIEGKINFSCKTDEEKEEIYEMAKTIKAYLGEGNPNNTSNHPLLSTAFKDYIQHSMSDTKQKEDRTDTRKW